MCSWVSRRARMTPWHRYNETSAPLVFANSNRSHGRIPPPRIYDLRAYPSLLYVRSSLARYFWFVRCRRQECEEAVLASSPEMVHWLARLALTRNTIMMPFPNALGYSKNTRSACPVSLTEQCNWDVDRPGVVVRLL